VLDKLSVYQLKITIKDSRPPIWRRLLLPSSATFWELHIAIQDSFGWKDYHLHEFFIGSAWDRNVVRINIPNPENDIYGEEKEPLDESKTKLYEYLNAKRSKITYVYDFGDNWEHQIILEKELPFDPNAAYPQAIDGKRACPWEDSGGVGGYKQKIEILKDKKHEEYKEISEWIGIDSFEQLDLESFDPDDVIFRNPATELRRVQKAIEREFS